MFLLLSHWTNVSLCYKRQEIKCYLTLTLKLVSLNLVLFEKESEVTLLFQWILNWQGDNGLLIPKFKYQNIAMSINEKLEPLLSSSFKIKLIKKWKKAKNNYFNFSRNIKTSFPILVIALIMMGVKGSENLTVWQS